MCTVGAVRKVVEDGHDSVPLLEDGPSVRRAPQYRGPVKVTVPSETQPRLRRIPVRFAEKVVKIAHYSRQLVVEDGSRMRELRIERPIEAAVQSLRQQRGPSRIGAFLVPIEVVKLGVLRVQQRADHEKDQRASDA